MGNTENRSNGKEHGDSNTLVISDNGGRVPRAALREAVMTKATLATIGGVNLSGLQVCLLPVRACADLFGCWAEGCTLWSDNQWGRIWGNHSQTAPDRERQGCRHIKMRPPPFLLRPSVPPLMLPLKPHCYSLLTTVAPLLGSFDQGLIRIAENFCA